MTRLTTVDFFFDPGCAWTWMTSRWVVEVAPVRGVAVRWRTFSVALNNGGDESPEPDRSPAGVALGALRVVEAVWAEEGDGPIGRLYTEIGERFHLRRDRSLAAVGEALEACELQADLLSAADDEAWDAEICASTEEAQGLVGSDVGVPILAFHDGDRVRAISGPVMSPAPTGDGALRLWDHVAGMAACESFFELKRSRTAKPQFAPPAG